MKSFFFRQWLCLVCTAALLLSLIPAAAFADGPVPEAAEAAETAPSEPLQTQALEPAPSEAISSEPAQTEPTEPIPSEPMQTEPSPSAPAEPELPVPVSLTPPSSGISFGQLHGHSSLSDETISPEAAFSTASQADHMDFYALTDHSDSFSPRDSGSGASADWIRGKAAAAAATTDSFLGLFGYEMNWPSRMQIGHIAVFATEDYESWNQPPYRDYAGALEAYYAALAEVPGAVAQFCHPGKHYGTFGNFAYCPAADPVLCLLELDFSETDPIRYYVQALDQGWHLCPTGCRDSTVRTAVFAEELTEDALCDAFRRCKAYATEDPDLQIRFSLDGSAMGSRVSLMTAGQTLDLALQLEDPSDSGSARAEILTTGGEVLASETLPEACGALDVSLPAAAGYYFVRITQADGDQAVTAPIWVESPGVLEISEFACLTQVPVQQEALSFSLELFNGETGDFLVDALEFLADGTPVFSDSTIACIPAGTGLSLNPVFPCSCVGATEITVRVTGTLAGIPRILESSLTVSLHQSRQVTAIAADGTHGNAGLDSLTLLKELARAENIRLTTVQDSLSPELLETCRFLLVTAPELPFSEDFLTAAAEFAHSGGHILICGQAGHQGNRELNRLLQAIGSSMTLGMDPVLGPAVRGAATDLIFSNCLNPDLPEGLRPSGGLYYRCSRGCAVDPGAGIWMVRAMDTGLSPETPVLLACEQLSGGGYALAAGSLFLSDDALKEPDNLWDQPYANRNILRSVLDLREEAVPLYAIENAREAPEDTLVRIRGHVTAGTANPYNTFPETIYLQDSTGGIALVPFSHPGISPGTPLEITGYVQTHQQNRVLKVCTWESPDITAYFPAPKSGSWKSLLNYSKNGGSLVEVTGTCKEIFLREDGTLSGCILEDEKGNRARILIEDCIFAGSDGKNDLHKTILKGRTVWAIGLLHVDAQGRTVLRVRNCEEVVYVPPRTYLNPRTADPLPPAVLPALCASLAGLLLLRKRRKV